MSGVRSMEYNVVHGVRGRLRVRFDDACFTKLTTANGRPAIDTILRAQPGISEVRLNRVCRTAVLEYDPDLRTEEDVLGLLSEVSTAPSTNGHHPESQPATAQEPEEAGSK